MSSLQTPSMPFTTSSRGFARRPTASSSRSSGNVKPPTPATFRNYAFHHNLQHVRPQRTHPSPVLRRVGSSLVIAVRAERLCCTHGAPFLIQSPLFND